MNKFKVVEVQFVEDYKLKITFADSHSVVVNFEPYFMENPNPVYSEYYNKDRFKEFKVENGNVVWGDSWDLIFNPKNLYYNDLFSNYESL